MPSSGPKKSYFALLLTVVLITAAGGLFAAVKDTGILLVGALMIMVIGLLALIFLFKRGRGGVAVMHNDPAKIAALQSIVQDSRNEVIGAMAILQQEIRILQDARYASPELAELRAEFARLAAELAAIKSARSKSVFVVETDAADVPPLSFDDADEKPIVAAKAVTPTPAAERPALRKADPIFVPEPKPELAKGLEPEAMEDNGDWLTGGMEEEDLVVSTKIDFESIVKKDAARPKPKIDEEEQRILREEMAQMADEDDWVGGGLEDRDVKVGKNSANDALLEKLRGEVQSERAREEAASPVRAPARGETALVVNVTLPHGNKLHIRGVGPGLDPEKGAAMQQSGHGKWQWICPDRGKPCVVTVWDNDETQSEGNPIRIPGGFALTVSPTFRRKLKLS